MDPEEYERVFEPDLAGASSSNPPPKALPNTIADKSSLNSPLFQLPSSTRPKIKETTSSLSELGTKGKPAASETKQPSLCEQRLMYAMDELADPLQGVRELCRKYVAVVRCVCVVSLQSA